MGKYKGMTNKEYHHKYYLEHKCKWNILSKKEIEKRKDDDDYRKRYNQRLNKYRKDGRGNYLENHKRDQKNYCYKNKDKIKARNLAHKIKISKNQNCVICKLSLATERHHKDYTKPLMVIFVCAKCHRKLDKEMKKFAI